MAAAPPPLLPPPIVDVAWLRASDDVVVCDVRNYLDGRVGRDAHEAGHLPGAVHVDLETALSSRPGPIVGRHPLPTPEDFAAALVDLGIGDDVTVVAYDDAGGMIAGRLVWMLRRIGQPASLLDGGVAAWIDDGGALETGPVEPRVGATRDVVPWPAERFVDADAVATHVADGGVVVDSRAPERFRGEVEPIDPKAGHVPGAINLPFPANLDGPLDRGQLLPDDEVRERFVDAGVDGDAIVYCGSGVSACQNLLAIEQVGLGIARLYVGSWSGWSSDPDRAVATGN